MSKPVIISQEQYDELIEDQNWLRHLEACGVDNWDGYSYAQETYED